MEEVMSGKYATESLEYQIRCYNQRVQDEGRGALPAELKVPDELAKIAENMAAYLNIHEITEDSKEAFKGVVTPILSQSGKYITAEQIKTSILVNDAVATMCHIKKESNHTMVKVLMRVCFNAEFVSSAKMGDKTKKRCFINPFYDDPTATGGAGVERGSSSGASGSPLASP